MDLSGSELGSVYKWSMTTAEPVVKWAGGKRQILAQIRTRLPKTMKTYYEPFIGGGAVFFALANRETFEKAVISDVNQELIDTYTVLAGGQANDLIEILKAYQNTREFFEEIRARKSQRQPQYSR